MNEEATEEINDKKTENENNKSEGENITAKRNDSGMEEYDNIDIPLIRININDNLRDKIISCGCNSLLFLYIFYIPSVVYSVFFCFKSKMFIYLGKNIGEISIAIILLFLYVDNVMILKSLNVAMLFLYFAVLSCGQFDLLYYKKTENLYKEISFYICEILQLIIVILGTFLISKKLK